MKTEQNAEPKYHILYLKSTIAINIALVPISPISRYKLMA